MSVLCRSHGAELDGLFTFYDGVDVTDSATAALEDKPTNTSIVTVVTARDADMATG